MSTRSPGPPVVLVPTRTRRSPRRYALLLLRLVVGVIFVLHGLSKFGLIGGEGFGGAISVIAEVDLPAPHITAPILAVVETLGGLALIVGLFTRPVAAVLAVVVAAEIALIKLPQSLNPFAQGGYLFELTLLAGLVALAWLGAGALSLEE